MHAVADNAEMAIETYNANPQRLWTTRYVDETAAISKDAKQVATLLRDSLRLAKDRVEEQRLDRSEGDAARF